MCSTARDWSDGRFHNDRTVHVTKILAIRPINNGYSAYFFITHTPNGHISTSSLKSDIATDVLDPNVPVKCKNFVDSSIDNGYSLYFLLHICRTAIFLHPV